MGAFAEVKARRWDLSSYFRRWSLLVVGECAGAVAWCRWTYYIHWISDRGEVNVARQNHRCRIIPDPINESSDIMSMKKVFEYCALGNFDCRLPAEGTKRLLAVATIYADTANSASLARPCLLLIWTNRFAGNTLKPKLARTQVL
jgi:hypothetical protein